jgi:sulfate transport system ATP-binding protein
MNRGKVEQVGSPLQVFSQPATPFACNFLGTVNRFDGKLGYSLNHSSYSDDAALLMKFSLFCCDG